MSQNVGEIDLSLILNSDKFSSQLKNIEGQANQASSKISGALKGIGKAALAAFSVAAITKFGKACVDVATETSNAWIGLNSILTGQGRSFSQAQKFIQDYVSDGLVPLNNAVGAYKNLALRGYSSDQIQKTMTALKNSATFARQSTYSLGDAVQTATEGLKNENSVVVDNAGVTKNVAKMWEDYAKSIGKTTNQLTQAEKIEAEVNGILEETKFQSNDAAIYANTYAGKLAQLNSAFTNMKVAIGNVIQPIAKLFIPMITAAANAVTKLFTAIAGLMSMFGLKADSVETVSKGLGGMAESADKASDAVKGVGDNAGKTAKKAKKAAQQLAGFDEMNKLSDTSDSSSGSGSGGAGGGASALSDALDVTTNIQQDTSAFDGMLDKVKELASIFKEGFNISFGDTNFDGIIGHLQGIKESIIDIWTDPDVLNSAGQWVDTMLFSLGQAVGAVARIGVNIVEGLLGSIDKYLSQNIDRIKTHICKMFDISSEDMALTGNLWQALGEISDVFSGDTAKQIGADIIAMFANPFMSVQEFCAKFVKDIKGVLFQPIIDNAEKIKTTFENVLEPIQTVTGTLAEAMTYVGDKWNEVYDTYISPFMESLKTGLSDTFSKFLDVYNEYVVPFLDNVANGINTLWTEHLKPLVDKFGELIGSVINALKVLWENWIKPIVDWIIQNVLPKLVPVFEGLWNTIKNIFGYIADAIGGIIDFFKGLIDFIVGVFTGDWNKAWEGIKTAFSGIWNAIKGIVQAVWEAIKGIVTNTINVIKTVISTVFNAIKTIITNIWNGIKTFITNIWNGIKDMISNVINGIKNTITNVFNGIKTSITNIWNAIITTITNVWKTIKTKVKEGAQGAWNAITGIFSGIANWFKNIFTQAWTNVKNVFSTGGKIFDGIKEGIVNFFKTIVNGIISGINKVIAVPFNAINGILQKIHDIDILGVKPFTWVHKFSVPEIPKLAQGGYVEANTPRLAVVGDNRTQGEIISPVDKMRDTFLSALQEFKNMNAGLGGDYVPIEINIPISLDGEEIQRLQDERRARLALATNGRRY